MSATASATPPPATRLTVDEALSSARETRALVIRSVALRDTARVFREQFPGCDAVIVADEHTFPLAGPTIAEALTAAGVSCVAPFIFTDPALYAEFRFVEKLEDSLRQHDAVPIAVGSG